MQSNHEKGGYGERLAVAWLKDAGYSILATNFRYAAGEIDVVASKPGLVVFIEVKYRRSLNCGYPAEAVTPAKQRTIREVADYYIYINELTEWDFRFDVVQIVDRGKPVIEHIVNAF